MGEAAALIRSHLWLGIQAPKPPDPRDSRPWSMARELSIWKRLIFLGVKAGDLNGAIASVRRLLGKRHKDVPLRLTIFYNHRGNATPLLEQCISEHFKAENKKGLRADVIPPTVRDILLKGLGVA